MYCVKNSLAQALYPMNASYYCLGFWDSGSFIQNQESLRRGQLSLPLSRTKASTHLASTADTSMA